MDHSKDICQTKTTPKLQFQFFEFKFLFMHVYKIYKTIDFLIVVKYLTP